METCPITQCANWHFYISFEQDKDGLWTCHKCGESGNLFQLREFLGDKMNNVTSMRDVAQARQPQEPLPNVEECHRRLMAEGEDPEAENPALEYLAGRGYTTEVIEKYKLGLEEKYGKRWLVIPYFTKGSLVFVKFRTLPPEEKDFRGLSGREAPLFNQDAIQKGMEELVIVEGEGDVLSCLSKGIEYVVGIPGANLKKAAWIKLLDDLEPKQIYLLYDNDKVGQEAAKEMAKRIGVDKVKNIVLPEFTFTADDGETKQGKDINEWFRAGHNAEDFEQLKADARRFSVDGVHSVAEVVDRIKQKLASGETLKPKYVTQYEELNRKIGGFEDGDLIGIMAEAKVGKTTWAMNLLDFLSVQYSHPALMFCQEMSPERQVEKWICYVTDTEHDKVTVETVDRAMDIAIGREADYLFAYTRSSKRQEVFDTIRQAVRRYGVKFVCFDNLQILCRSLEHSAQETSVICKEFKQLAMELGIVILLIIQPHRVQEGHIIGARNAHGSSAIEKDVDMMLCLHRNREGKVSAEDFASIGYMEIDENFCPEMLVRADLTRYAGGGAVTLYMDGARSKVTSLTREQIEQKKGLMPVLDPMHNVQPQQFEAA